VQPALLQQEPATHRPAIPRSCALWTARASGQTGESALLHVDIVPKLAAPSIARSHALHHVKRPCNFVRLWYQLRLSMVEFAQTLIPSNLVHARWPHVLQCLLKLEVRIDEKNAHARARALRERRSHCSTGPIVSLGRAVSPSGTTLCDGDTLAAAQ
jgi:hypothetical protein